jgi:hypothetical protein
VAGVILREAERSDLSAILDLSAQDELSTSPSPTDLAPVVQAFEAIASDPKASLYVVSRCPQCARLKASESR